MNILKGNEFKKRRGHCIGRYSLTFYTEFESNDKSVLTQITILCNFNVSNT